MTVLRATLWRGVAVLLVLLFAGIGVTPAVGDWNPGDGHKMHFPQLPDEAGWDVMATFPFGLADDWRCTQSGPVNDIHFWGSWRHGDTGQIIGFDIRIYSDIPADPPDVPYSRPGNLLWQWFAEDPTIVPIDPPTMEGWLEPPDFFIENDHQNYFQYNFRDIPDPFFQQEGQIYWLFISATLAQPENTQWGWKSSLDHWNDDAVFNLAPFPPDAWQELYEPPIFQRSLDLSFVIGCSPAPPNDDCINATGVNEVIGLPFDTSCASFDGNGTCLTSPNIWYCYTATCTGLATIDTCDSGFDTIIAVYDGCACYPDASNELCCDDDGCPTSLSSLCTINVVAGNEYLIEIGGFNNAVGPGVLNIDCQAQPPPNDDCDDAIPIGEVTALPFDTTDATNDGLNQCMISPNIWYCYTPSCTGTATVSLCGSSYDTMLAVYDGCACYPTSVDMICCDDDGCGGSSLASKCEFSVVAGQQYLIEVGGWGSLTGPGVMTITCDDSCFRDWFFFELPNGFGGGSGYEEGSWFYYPNFIWWNQWFYDGEFRPENFKMVDLNFEIVPFGPNAWYELVVNWSTPQWSAMGLNRPPLPGDVPDPGLEQEFIGRSEILAGGPLQGPQLIDLRYFIWDYNPEWVSVDIRGNEFQIDGEIVHCCYPRCKVLDGPDYWPYDPVTDPTIFPWHELWPLFCNWWDATDWINTPAVGQLDYCDYLYLSQLPGPTGQWWHVENVTITVEAFDPQGPGTPVYFDWTHGWQPGDPAFPFGTWHEVYPNYCTDWQCIAWQDTNGNTVVDPGDFLDMQSPDGLVTIMSVGWVATDVEVCEQRPCAGDATHDGVVDTDDFLAVLSGWGPCPLPCPPFCLGDVTFDCVVNTDDFLLVLGNWGPCPNGP